MLNPRVKVLEGELEGKVVTSLEGKEYYSFQGIPYAEPPLGELRFKPPVAKKPWLGVRDATSEGSPCAQLDFVRNSYFGSEDCLFLNVYTPELSNVEATKLLPVMCYIHGGGFVMGSGSSDWFSPDFIVAKDTILVTFNYRLGALGFLCLDIPEAPGNVGLKDQNLVLKWVQNNIRAFNGDPDNVTIFGISAGSASVEYHILSPMSEGLFHKAILQSGCPLNPVASTKNPRKLVDNLTKQLGVNAQDSEELVHVLQKVEVEQLITSAFNVLDDEHIRTAEMFAFMPVVEITLPGVEAFLNMEPLEVLTSGKFNNVPTITGFCVSEGNMFKTQYGTSNMENLKQRNFIDYLPSHFKVDKARFDILIREIYDEEDEMEAVNNFLSDLCFIGGIFVSLKKRLLNNSLANFLYIFTYEGTLNLGKIVFKGEGEKGSYHADDSSYLGSNVFVKDFIPTASDLLVRSRMVQMWTDFAKHGNPTPIQSGSLPTWLPVTIDKLDVMEIGEELKMRPFPLAKRMKFWETIFSSLHVTPRNVIP